MKAGEDVDVKSSTGKYFDSSEPTTGELHVITATADTTDFTVGSDSVTIYAAATVTPGTGVTATYDMTTTGTKNLPGTRDVAVGTELTLTVASTNGSVVIEGNGPVATEKLDSKITVEDDITLTAAWEVVLGEGVTATIGSARTAGTYYVVDSTSISAITAVSGGTNVVELNSRGYADATASLSSVTEDVTLAVATKVEFNNSEIASFTYTIDGETSDSIPVTSSGFTLYFVEGTILNVVGKASGTAGENITVNSSDVENGVASTTVEGATGTFTVGDTAITVSQG